MFSMHWAEEAVLFYWVSKDFYRIMHLKMADSLKAFIAKQHIDFKQLAMPMSHEDSHWLSLQITSLPFPLCQPVSHGASRQEIQKHTTDHCSLSQRAGRDSLKKIKTSSGLQLNWVNVNINMVKKITGNNVSLSVTVITVVAN